MANVLFPSFNSGYNWKVILFLNAASGGWEDVWYYNNTGSQSASAAWADVIAATRYLAQQRQITIASNTTIQGARITALFDGFQLLGTNGESLPLSPADLNVPANTALTANPSIDVSVQAFARTSPPGVHKIWQSRGWSGGAISGPAGTTFPFVVGPSVTGPFNTFAFNILNNAAAPFKGTFCMRGRVRVNVLNPTLPNIIGTLQQNVLAVSATGSPGNFIYTIATPTPNPYAAGIKIIVAKVLLKCGKGANGAMTILSVDNATTAGKTVITTNNPWRCAGMPSYNSFGYLYGEQFGLYTIGQMSAVRIGNRQTGKPNFTTRGRRSAIVR